MRQSVCFTPTGRIGDIVYVRMRNGRVYAKPLAAPRDPKSKAQTDVRRRMALASHAYTNLTQEQHYQWEMFVRTYRNALAPMGSEPSVNGIFISYGMKYLQVNPGGSVPVLPPDGLFPGDAVQVVAVGTSTGVSCSTNTPNAGGVTTELLLQPLSTGHSKPQTRAYRTKGFHEFSVSAPTIELEVPAKWYAPAVRFVKISTGQCTEVLPYH